MSAPQFGLLIIQQGFDSSENSMGGALWGNDEPVAFIAGVNVEARAAEFILARQATDKTYKGWDGATYPEYRTKLVRIHIEEETA